MHDEGKLQVGYNILSNGEAWAIAGCMCCACFAGSAAGCGHTGRPPFQHHACAVAHPHGVF